MTGDILRSPTQGTFRTLASDNDRRHHEPRQFIGAVSRLRRFPFPRPCGQVAATHYEFRLGGRRFVSIRVHADKWLPLTLCKHLQPLAFLTGFPRANLFDLDSQISRPPLISFSGYLSSKIKCFQVFQGRFSRFEQKCPLRRLHEAHQSGENDRRNQDCRHEVIAQSANALVTSRHTPGNSLAAEVLRQSSAPERAPTSLRLRLGAPVVG